MRFFLKYGFPYLDGDDDDNHDEVDEVDDADGDDDEEYEDDDDDDDDDDYNYDDGEDPDDIYNDDGDDDDADDDYNDYDYNDDSKQTKPRADKQQWRSHTCESWRQTLSCSMITLTMMGQRCVKKFFVAEISLLVCFCCYLGGG